jgi:hypothetical protein
VLNDINISQKPRKPVVIITPSGGALDTTLRGPDQNICSPGRIFKKNIDVSRTVAPQRSWARSAGAAANIDFANGTLCAMPPLRSSHAAHASNGRKVRSFPVRVLRGEGQLSQFRAKVSGSALG